VISLSIPFDTWALRRVHYALCYSGTIPSRRWWTLDGKPMWADVIEAEYEQERRGGKLMKGKVQWVS